MFAQVTAAPQRIATTTGPSSVPDVKTVLMQLEALSVLAQQIEVQSREITDRLFGPSLRPECEENDKTSTIGFFPAASDFAYIASSRLNEANIILAGILTRLGA